MYIKIFVYDTINHGEKIPTIINVNQIEAIQPVSKNMQLQYGYDYCFRTGGQWFNIDKTDAEKIFNIIGVRI